MHGWSSGPWSVFFCAGKRPGDGRFRQGIKAFNSGMKKRTNPPLHPAGAVKPPAGRRVDPLGRVGDRSRDHA